MQLITKQKPYFTVVICCFALMACGGSNNPEISMPAATTEQSNAEEIQVADYLIPSTSSNPTFLDISIEDGIEQIGIEYSPIYEVGEGTAELSIDGEGFSYTETSVGIFVQELDDPDDTQIYPTIVRVGGLYQISDDDSIFIANVYDSFAMETQSTTYTSYLDVMQVDFPVENETLYFARGSGLIGYYSRACRQNRELVEDVPDDQCDTVIYDYTVRFD